MPDTGVTAAPVGPPPQMHPMDPRRGESLSPLFDAFLCRLPGLEPMTAPTISRISVAGGPLFNASPGSVRDFERNLRGWGEACGAGAATVDGLVDRMRSAGR